MQDHARNLPAKAGVYRLWIKDHYYVGSTIDVAHRFYNHRGQLKRGAHGSRQLQEFYDREGGPILLDFVIPMWPEKDESAEAFRKRIYAEERKYLVCEHEFPRSLNATRGTNGGADFGDLWKDPEWKAKKLAQFERQKKDHDWLARVSEKNKKYWSDPERRKKNSETSKALWRDPKYRAKMEKACENCRGGRNPGARRCLLSLKGEDHEFSNVRAAAGWVGVNEQTLINWLKGKAPWPGSGRVNRFPELEGLCGRYLDDPTILQ